jgi:hypothetical protein
MTQLPFLRNDQKPGKALKHSSYLGDKLNAANTDLFDSYIVQIIGEILPERFKCLCRSLCLNNLNC